MPRPGQVLGLVGTNGIGKSTALKILSGKLKPNLGRYDNPPDWEEILRYFRGSELQSKIMMRHKCTLIILTASDYFTKVLEDDLKAVVKPQYVDQIPKAVKGPERSVEALLQARAQVENLGRILDVLGLFPRSLGRRSLTYLLVELRQVLDRDIDKLSGGELQRFAIAVVCVQQADV